jgi:hypothetical protein
MKMPLHACIIRTQLMVVCFLCRPASSWIQGSSSRQLRHGGGSCRALCAVSQPQNSNAGGGASSDRDAKLARYAELFSIPDMPSDARRLNAQQIAAGKKPWFEIRREKAAIYDRLFSMGTTRYFILPDFEYPNAFIRPRRVWNAVCNFSVQMDAMLWKAFNRKAYIL